MSEETSELLTGRAGVEAFHGYEPRTPAPEPEPPKTYEGADGVTEAANDLTRARGTTSEAPLEKLEYTERPEPGKKYSVTAEQAAKDLSQYHRDQALSAALPDLQTLQQSVDYARLVVNAGVDPQLAQQAIQPDAAQPQAGEPQSPQPDGPQPEAPEQPPSGLSPKVQAALSDPEVRAAIEPALRASQVAVHQYAAATADHAAAAMASILAAYPELSGYSAAQLPTVLSVIAQNDPQKAAEIQGHVAKAQAIYAQAQQAHAAQLHQQHAQFQNWAKQQDAEFAKATGGESPETISAAGREIVSFFEESGVPKEALVQMWQTNPALRSSVAQQVMLGFAKMRMAQRTATANPASRNHIPPVVRPGIARGRSDHNAEQIRDLTHQLKSARGNEAARIGAKLLQAKRAAR